MSCFRFPKPIRKILGFLTRQIRWSNEPLADGLGMLPFTAAVLKVRRSCPVLYLLAGVCTLILATHLRSHEVQHCGMVSFLPLATYPTNIS